MAQAPDPQTFASWEDAFKYPVATVQQMERQLRNEINTNGERLRSLVGASYRDLLGTAESIIEMDAKIQGVEVYLGNMSGKCNTRFLERKVSNMKSWDRERRIGDRDRYAFASQLAVLRSCPEVISRLLKEKASVLLAAKVLVLSRLLHTKLSQRPQPCPYLDTLRHRLATLRRRLLARVDRAMKKVDQTSDVLVDAMCAFALATSSSPLDVLRHYHHVRLEAIQEQKQNYDIKSRVSLSLKMYINTLKDTKAVVPSQLPQALRGLKSAPLLENAEMYGLVELNLDLHEKHLGDDIRIFTPYIRLEDLQKSDFENLLKTWAKEAFSTLLSNLRANLGEIDDAHQLMVLRTETLQLWFSNQHYATGLASAEVVDQLRDVFISQWSSIVERKAASLTQVTLAMSEIFRDGQDRLSDDDLSLWTPSMLSPEMTNGAKKFREALTTRLQGRSEALKLAFDQYAQWTVAINAIEDSIQTASAIKWVDNLNDIEDDDEILNHTQTLLSEDDPRMVKEGLSESVEKAFNDLQESLQHATDDLEDEKAGQRAVLLVRMWREIRQNLPNSYHNASLGLDAIRSLHRLIARSAAKAPLERGKLRARKTYSKAKLPGGLLWEGTPPTPRLPSPWAFRFLHELSHSMADIGSDVWSPQLIISMKQHLRESLASNFQEQTPTEPSNNGYQREGHDPERADERAGSMQDAGVKSAAEESESARAESNGARLNGGVHESPSDHPPQEIQVQRLFDLLYLMNATATEKQETDDDALAELQASAERDLGLAPELVKGMKKGADEYWKRTSLLFGLLA